MTFDTYPAIIYNFGTHRRLYSIPHPKAVMIYTTSLKKSIPKKLFHKQPSKCNFRICVVYFLCHWVPLFILWLSKVKCKSDTFTFSNLRKNILLFLMKTTTEKKQRSLRSISLIGRIPSIKFNWQKTQTKRILSWSSGKFNIKLVWW